MQSKQGKYRDYQKKYQREYRKNNPDKVKKWRLKWYKKNKHTTQNKKKDKCRMLVRDALKRGDIKKQPCEKCSNKKSEAHHDNYNQPLKIKWLCRKCHYLIHRKK